MNEELHGPTVGTRTTRQLAAGDHVITPGAVRGVVRRTFPAGILSQHPGRTTVQLLCSSVYPVNGGEVPSPRAWVTCDDDADWQIER
ncbi:hypothetical protein FKR81_00055 [Lentzea tibetensis]|uniref:Uncharacterized protein n=1 Tax=Lentzea tibetensis TaxID=2591470 RepID=A0A563F1Z3_9PSEU|nr:hypothetical protein [Lentzea tibetensis]TWP54006.1 hypothetical protein FKR81_00055 [Lentzea tibetensis]